MYRLRNCRKMNIHLNAYQNVRSFELCSLGRCLFCTELENYYQHSCTIYTIYNSCQSTHPPLYAPAPNSFLMFVNQAPDSRTAMPLCHAISHAAHCIESWQRRDHEHKQTRVVAKYLDRAVPWFAKEDIVTPPTPSPTARGAPKDDSTPSLLVFRV